MSSCTFESETLIKKQLEANIAFNNFVLAKLTMNDLTCKKAFYNVTLSRLPFCAKKNLTNLQQVFISFNHQNIWIRH